MERRGGEEHEADEASKKLVIKGMECLFFNDNYVFLLKAHAYCMKRWLAGWFNIILKNIPCKVYKTGEDATF